MSPAGSPSDDDDWLDAPVVVHPGAVGSLPATPLQPYLDAMNAAIAEITAATGEESADEKKPSWAFADLDVLLDEEYVPPKPELWRWDDGQGNSGHLLYRGKVHVVMGQPGTWKTYASLHGVASVLLDGGTACVIDSEEDLRVAISRLRLLGVPVATLRERCRFVAPEEDWNTDLEYDSFHHLLSTPFDVVLIDSFAAVSALSGVKENSNDEVTIWFQKVPLRVAKRTGAAVLVVDHVAKPTNDTAKGADRYAIGAQSKLARVQVTFRMQASDTPPGKVIDGRPGSGVGTTDLVVMKDRFGELGGEGTRYHFDVDSRGDIVYADERRVSVTISCPYEVPKTKEEVISEREANRRAAIIRALQTHTEGLGVRAMRTEAKTYSDNQALGGAAEIDQTVKVLIAEGIAVQTAKGQSLLTALSDDWKDRCRAAGILIPDEGPPEVGFDPTADLAPEPTVVTPAVLDGDVDGTAEDGL